MLQKITKCLLLLVLFLIPWQTRLIYEPAFINGAPWEYGTKSLYGIELLLGLLIICGLIPLATQGRAAAKKPSFWVFGLGALGFLTWVILSSTNPGVSYQFVTWLVLGACLATLIKNTVVPKVHLLGALWLGGVLQGFLALEQFFTQQVVGNKWFGLASHTAKELGASVIEFGDQRWLRAYGSFGSPNSLGIYLAVILVVGLVIYATIQSSKIKLAVTAGQMIVLSGLILSFSRGAWIAAGCGCLALLVLQYRKHQSRELGKQFLWYAFVTLFFVVILQPLFFARFTPSNRLEARSINERTGQLREAWHVINEHPLRGVGPGSYTVALANKHPAATAFELQPVHNIYFLIVAEWGIPMSMLLAALYCYGVYVCWKKQNTIGVVLVVLGSAGLFDHWLYSLLTGQLLWFIGWGLALNGSNFKPGNPLDSSAK